MTTDVTPGNRKVVLTKWMLVVFAVGTIGYLILMGIKGETPPDSFYMSFVLGLGTIGGAFTVGNIFENRARGLVEQMKTQVDLEKEKKQTEVEKKERLNVEKDKAQAELEKEKVRAGAEKDKAQAEVDLEKIKAETEKDKARAQIEKQKLGVGQDFG